MTGGDLREEHDEDRFKRFGRTSMRPGRGSIVGLLVALALGTTACGSKPVPAKQSEPTPGLSVGEQAPAFSLPSASGTIVSLADFRGEQTVHLYFSMGPG